jgi:nitric oxide dioxygenase
MLSTTSAAVVRATLPAVRAHADAISTTLHASVLAETPVPQSVFNGGSDSTGAQSRALAAVVVAFADHLLGGARVPIGTVLERVAHKHASLGVLPERYAVVGKHLVRAVHDVLGDAVTPAVATAWEELYLVLATRMREVEAVLYQDAGVDPRHPVTPWRVTHRQVEAEDAVSLLLVPADDAPPPGHRAGQYVTVVVDLPEGGRQARQYSLSRAPGHSCTRVTVRRARGAGGAPDGLVSTHLCDRVGEGDVLEVSHPFGEFVPGTTGGPLVLVSAGIGIAPIAAVVEHLADEGSRRQVIAVHADRTPERHVLREHVLRHGTRLESFRQWNFYESGATGAVLGRVRTADFPVPPGASAYLCGPPAFVREVGDDLVRRGVPAHRVHREVFGPELVEIA